MKPGIAAAEIRNFTDGPLDAGCNSALILAKSSQHHHFFVACPIQNHGRALLSLFVTGA